MPPILYSEPEEIQGDYTPTYFLEYQLPVSATAAQHNLVVLNEDIPASFTQGLAELEQGHAIDFDNALENPPQPE